METISIIVLLSFGVGTILFVIGLLNILTNNKTVVNNTITAIGLFILVGSAYFTLSIKEDKQESLVQEVADLLETTPGKIILEDISKTSTLFSSGKNESLRKVYYDSKVYLLEVDGYGYKVVKLGEIKDGTLSDSKEAEGFN